MHTLAHVHGAGMTVEDVVTGASSKRERVEQDGSLHFARHVGARDKFALRSRGLGQIGCKAIDRGGRRIPGAHQPAARSAPSIEAPAFAAQAVL
jgi:hypothetical protein